MYSAFKNRFSNSITEKALISELSMPGLGNYQDAFGRTVATLEGKRLLV
jgi:hypothetical protein